MSAPSAGLWLPEKRSAFDVVPWLAAFCEVQAEDDESVEFHVGELSALGVDRLKGPSLGLFHLGPESLEDYEALGFPGLERPPSAALALSAYCSGPDNHLLVGHLALFIAEHLEALIDFGGLLDVPVSSLPGQVWEMPYRMYGGEHGYSHTCDREFLGAWLTHPDFHMIR